MVLDLKGKRALITGGSAGVGLATSQLLSQLGVACAVNYSSDDSKGEKALASLQGEGHFLIKGSVFEHEGADGVVEEAIKKLGGLDIIVSNAGWTKFAPYENLTALSDAEWQKCFSANVLSHLWIMQKAEEELKRTKGVMIIVASIAGMYTTGSSMAYAVTKSSAIHLAKTLTKAVAPHGVRVNSVAPGLVMTEWAKGFPPEAVEGYNKQVAMGKPCEVEDVAEGIVGLIRNESITGHNLEISRGFRQI